MRSKVFRGNVLDPGSNNLCVRKDGSCEDFGSPFCQVSFFTIICSYYVLGIRHVLWCVGTSLLVGDKQRHPALLQSLGCHVRR